MNLGRKSWLLIFASISLTYILLRLWNLTSSCIWFDEIFSVNAAEHSWNSLAWFVAQDLIHPPLSYFLLKIWIALGGQSILWLRLFPVFFSTLALVPFFLLCKRLKLDNPAIAFALTFFAVNGSLIKYAQEVRMYSLLLFFSLFSMWSFRRFIDGGTGVWLLTLVNILLIYTHYFGWLVIVSQVFIVIIFHRKDLRKFAVSFGVTVLSFLPWLWLLLKALQVNSNISQNLGWADRPGILAVVKLIFNLIEPFFFQMSNVDPVSVWVVSIPFLIVIASAAVYFLYSFRNKESERSESFFLVSFIAIPLVIAFLASWVMPYSVWGTRHLIVVVAPLAILLGMIFGGLKRGSFRAIAAAIVMAILLLGFGINASRKSEPQIWCVWDEFAGDLKKKEPREKTDLYVFEDLIAYQFWFSLRNDPNFEVAKIDGIPEITEDTAYFLPRDFGDVRKFDANKISENRFFLAFRADEFDSKKQPLRFFILKGYRVGDPKKILTSGQKAFLVLMEKSN